jgi:hypothetical protein
MSFFSFFVCNNVGAFAQFQYQIVKFLAVVIELKIANRSTKVILKA